MGPVIAIPAAILAFLAGAAVFGPGRRGLSMLKPEAAPDVIIIRWRRFRTIMARHPRDFRSPRGHYGMYGMDMRRLADVGFCEAPKKTTVGSESGVWSGAWKAPVTEAEFLGSEELQETAFARSMNRLAPRLASLVGTEVDGQKCSLSGLLAVGHHAGEKGVLGWVKSAEMRKKFSNTTEAFQRANNIF